MGTDTFPWDLSPMRAVAAERLPPDDNGWAYEVKWDGVRALTFVRDGRVSVRSRSGRDVTVEYPELSALADAGPTELAVDGELVALDDAGRPRFELLQQRINLREGQRGANRRAAVPVVYMVFDLLYCDGHTFVDTPYEQRRAHLAEAIDPGPIIQVPRHHVGHGAELLEATRSSGLEGLVAKRLGSPYLPGQRSRHWLKVKNFRRQELVVGGWLPGRGGRQGTVGALLVGHYTGNALRYAGRVGTGFSDAELTRLESLLIPRTRATSPFAEDPPLPPQVKRDGRFVEPELVAEVAFSEWTRGGTLRQPSYKGLRADVEPSEVRRELPE